MQAGPMAVGVLAVLLASLVSSSARAAFEIRDTGWQGTSAMLEVARARLGRERVLVPDRLDWQALDPADGLLLIHPEEEVDFGQASAFLRAGGRIAVLDDFGQGWSLLERFQIRRADPPSKPAQVLRQNPALAVAAPATHAGPGRDVARHPIVTGVDQLVTNHPVALVHPDLTPVLSIPTVDGPDATLAVTGIIVNRGRLFAMGDPSAVINLMLRYPGNRAFAEGLAGYLVEDDDGRERGGRLFVFVNSLSQHGHFGDAPTFSEELEDRLRDLKSAVSDARRDGLPAPVSLVLAALAAVTAALWAGSFALRLYRQSTPRYAAAVPLVAQGGVAGRAAVLQAPTTQRGLAVLELKSALEEGMALRLKLSETASSSVLLSELRQRGLMDGQRLEELRGLFSELDRIAARVLEARPTNPSAAAVERIRGRVEAALADVESAVEVRARSADLT